MCSSAVAPPDVHELVISRDYISNGFRDRAAGRVTIELGPRTEQEIRASLEKEVNAERLTSLDRSLRAISDENGEIADLRPGGAGEDSELRRLMLGRAAKLERLGMAEQVGPAQWTMSAASSQPCAISASAAASNSKAQPTRSLMASTVARTISSSLTWR
jgi:type IV secretory pathway VirD2 relaxase